MLFLYYPLGLVKVLPINDTRLPQKQKTVTFAPVYAKRDGWYFRSPRIFFSDQSTSLIERCALKNQRDGKVVIWQHLCGPDF